MKRQFKINISSYIIFLKSSMEYKAIILNSKNNLSQFVHIMDLHGNIDLILVQNIPKHLLIEQANCPDARFLKVLLGSLNFSNSSKSSKEIIHAFNKSFVKLQSTKSL